MKIVICGKGGSGKSAISALVAKSLAKRGHSVLVIDIDESNVGLHRRLGMGRPDDLMSYVGGRKAFMRSKDSFAKKWKSDDIPEEYISKKNGIKLLTIGKIHDFGEGCACPMGALSRELLDHLELEANEIVIVDTDAGIEHFGRGVEHGCDLILLVVDPSYESILLSKNVDAIAKGMGKPLYFVLNKVDDDTKGVMSKSLDRDKVAAAIPTNNNIFNACLSGEEIDMNLREIEELTDVLEAKDEAHKL